jgi:hypothetical protein
MRIVRQDLPISMAEAYEALLEAFSTPPSSTGTAPYSVFPDDPSLLKAKKSVLAAENSNKGWALDTLFTTLILLIDAAALMGILIVWVKVGGIASLFPLLATVGLNWVFIRWCRQREQRRRYRPELLRAVLPLVAKTTSEEMYVLALLKLVEQDALLGETLSRGLLSQMNTLLIRSQEIQQQEEHTLAATSNQSRVEIEATHQELTYRLVQVVDPEARETLQQTLLICEARLQRVKSLTPLQERLEAQQAMIQQTLASVGEVLAGLILAPQAIQTPRFDSVQESLEHIQRQTKSIERAVQEVMALQRA